MKNCVEGEGYRNDSKFLDGQTLANSADPDQTRGAVL